MDCLRPLPSRWHYSGYLVLSISRGKEFTATLFSLSYQQDENFSPNLELSCWKLHGLPTLLSLYTLSASDCDGCLSSGPLGGKLRGNFTSSESMVKMESCLRNLNTLLSIFGNTILFMLQGKASSHQCMPRSLKKTNKPSGDE